MHSSQLHYSGVALDSYGIQIAEQFSIVAIAAAIAVFLHGIVVLP